MKHFRIEGLCIPDKHYMVDTSSKINKLIEIIDKGYYFTINKPTQFGKTTTLNLLKLRLSGKYIIIKISFEGIGNEAFKNEENFCTSFIKLIRKSFQLSKNMALMNFIDERTPIESFVDLDLFITDLVLGMKKDVVLILDEVDKATNNDIFVNFLGLLRSKYLARDAQEDISFHSVILASIYDIKNVKKKLTNSDAEASINSPWNISYDINLDMNFTDKDISTMLLEYEKENLTCMDVSTISEVIYNYTSGYPYLVSYICKLIDEELKKKWTNENVRNAIDIILAKKITLFDVLVKTLDKYKDLYNAAYDILINGTSRPFNFDEYDIGYIIGIFKKDSYNNLIIHNKIFETRIYNYLVSKFNENYGSSFNYKSLTNNVRPQQTLNMEFILEKFQELIKNDFSELEFLEKYIRLALLSYLKSVIDGIGHYYIDSLTRNNNRIDIIICYNNSKYIIQLKNIYDKKDDKEMDTFADYVHYNGETEGYVIYNCLYKGKKLTNGWIDEPSGKKIYELII